MESHYNQNYSAVEIDGVLQKVKECVRQGKFTVSLNERRQENQNFIQEYNIKNDRLTAILLQIQTEDFCHTLQNTKPGYEYETLYVFVPQVHLFNISGEEETVDVYMKFNVIENTKGVHTVVISFHKRNKPITYLFR